MTYTQKGRGHWREKPVNVWPPVPTDHEGIWIPHFGLTELSQEERQEMGFWCSKEVETYSDNRAEMSDSRTSFDENSTPLRMQQTRTECLTHSVSAKETGL